jgi:hypothetical protein
MVKSDAKILEHGQFGENPPALWHITQAQSGNQMRLDLVGAGIAEGNGTAAGRRQPHNAPECRRFANAITAQKSHGLAVPDLKVDALKDMAFAVVRIQSFEFKQ